MRAVRLAAALGAAVLLLGACTSDDRSGIRTVDPGQTVSPTTGMWVRVADAPGPARQEVAAAARSNLVYVVGGLIGGGDATDAVVVYDATLDSWSAAPALPTKIHHSMAAFLGENLVVIGGLQADGRPSDRVFMLKGNRWREGPKLRRPRGAGAAVTIGERIIVVGGVASGGHVAPVEIFDGTAWRDGAAIPSLRDHIGAATDGKLVYVAGGRRAGGHFATLEAYDPVADRWTKLPDMPTARSGNGATFVNGKFVTAGGEGPRMFPEVEAYDIARRAWTRLPDLAVPVHGVGLVAVEDKVYALVGGVEVGLAPSRAAQVLRLG